jgi:hypothetical protein
MDSQEKKGQTIIICDNAGQYLVAAMMLIVDNAGAMIGQKLCH